MAQRLGRRLGFDERFVTGLGQLYARWDGKGVPAVGGDAILPAVRVVILAQDMTAHGRARGYDAVASVVRERAGPSTTLRSRKSCSRRGPPFSTTCRCAGTPCPSSSLRLTTRSTASRSSVR